MKKDGASATAQPTTTPKPSADQSTLQSSFDRQKVWAINSERSKAVHTSIGEMIAADMQPLSIVDDVGFNRLVSLLEPRYSPPSRKYMTDTVMPEIHAKMKATIAERDPQTGRWRFCHDRHLDLFGKQ